MTLKIKNWSNYQHYKTRNPPWIRLHKGIIDDPDWHELDGASAKVLVMLWLIASEDKSMEGSLPCTRKLAFRLRMTEHQINQAISKLSHWLEHDASTALAERLHAAPKSLSETETETETDNSETETDNSETELLARTSDDGPEPLLSIPLNKKGSFFEVTQNDVDQWQETFPAVDVVSEIKKCRQWNIDNPKRRKTKFGIRNHISSWLGRVQDKGGSGKQPVRDKRNEYDETRERFAKELIETGSCSPGSKAVVNQIQGPETRGR